MRLRRKRQWTSLWCNHMLPVHFQHVFILKFDFLSQLLFPLLMTTLIVISIMPLLLILLSVFLVVFVVLIRVALIVLRISVEVVCCCVVR